MPAGILSVLFLADLIPKMFGGEFGPSLNPDEGWELTSGNSDIAIYIRPHPGSSLKELKGIGEIDAPSDAVQAVIDDFENYPKFMPYVTQCQLVKRDNASIVSYQRISPKICADRDYTLRVWKKSWPTADGLVFTSHWATANELGPPAKKGVVRVTMCNGSWLLEPEGSTKTRATYCIFSDTGGAIPSFIANSVGKVGVKRVFEAVRTQVKNPKYAVAKR